MKNFILIILSSTLIFFLVSLLEEWENFKPLFFKSERVELKFPEEALKVIDDFNLMLVHIYRFSDERFFQRLPASEKLKDEIFEDLYYLNSYGIIQDLKQIKKEILKKNLVSKGVLRVEVYEEWEVFYLDSTGHPLQKKPSIFSSNLYYILVEKPYGWIVEEMGIINAS